MLVSFLIGIFTIYSIDCFKLLQILKKSKFVPIILRKDNQNDANWLRKSSEKLQIKINQVKQISSILNNTLIIFQINSYKLESKTLQDVKFELKNNNINASIKYVKHSIMARALSGTRFEPLTHHLKNLAFYIFLRDENLYATYNIYREIKKKYINFNKNQNIMNLMVNCKIISTDIEKSILDIRDKEFAITKITKQCKSSTRTIIRNCYSSYNRITRALKNKK